MINVLSGTFVKVIPTSEGKGYPREDLRSSTSVQGGCRKVVVEGSKSESSFRRDPLSFPLNDCFTSRVLTPSELCLYPVSETEYPSSHLGDNQYSGSSGTLFRENPGGPGVWSRRALYGYIVWTCAWGT